MSLNIVKGFEPRSSTGLECIRTVLQSFDMKAEPLGTPHWNSRKVCLDRLTQGPNRHGLLYFNAGIMYFWQIISKFEYVCFALLLGAAVRALVCQINCCLI